MRTSMFFKRFIGVFLTLVFISPDALALTNTILKPVTFTQASDVELGALLESIPFGWKDEHTAYLGVSADDALGKPGDDVFEFYISEAELAVKELTISYSVNGVEDAKSMPFTVNGRAQYGEVDHQGKKGWQRVSLKIPSTDLNEGRNAVLFSLPEGVAQAQVKAVTLTPEASSAKKAHPMPLTVADAKDFSSVYASTYYQQFNEEGGSEEVKEISPFPSYAMNGSQIASIPGTFTNMTRGAVAYRSYGPKDSTTHITIGVDPSVGYERLREVKVFYFDYDQKDWVQAHVSKVNHASYTLEADGEGGTDYFAAMIKTPEMPEASAFMPTSVSDLEPANPATGINLIQPPTANQQGDANISYPLAIPQGRQGMTPQVSLNYSSSGGSGWAGYGWSVPVQSISVDTRWGVPTYSTTLESEVYLFNGESLHAEDGVKANRPEVTTSAQFENRLTGTNGEVRFFTKQQGAYSEITRHGAKPGEYYWTVKDASGNTFYYGGDENGRNADAIFAKNATSPGARWYLTKVEDRFGNNIIYSYRKHLNTSQNTILSGGVSMWLNKIEYTGYYSRPGKYALEFNVSDRRSDTRVSYANGIKELDDRQLTSISVKYDGVLQKKFVLNFVEGDWKKQLLQSIGVEHDGNLFYEHEFEYFSNSTISYGDEQTIDLNVFDHNLFEDFPEELAKIKADLNGSMAASPIKTTTTYGWNFGGSPCNRWLNPLL